MLIQTLLTNPLEFLVIALALVISLTVHEFAHAYVAYRLGDPTAKMMGRLTLNPLVHLDIFGTLMLLFAGFGWAKPVPVNDYNLKNPRRDIALVSFAGPASNFILAVICAFLAQALFSNSFIGQILILITLFNLSIGFFNLIPVHPLDGFKIVEQLLPDHLAYQWSETARYGFIILAVMFLTGLPSRVLQPLVAISMNLLGLGI